MGQYYRPILGDSFGLNCKVFDRSIDGEYTMAKLLEHSWWQNPFVNAFSEFLYNEPSRVIWCGDYADEPDDFNFPNCSAFYVPYYGEIWGESITAISVSSSDFTLDGKFLLNHDTKQFVDLNEYKANSIDKHGWTIHPLPLLTAIGNGRGGGDFHEGNTGYENVGIWAWQLISIEDTPPKDFSKFNIKFIEIR
ncbi:MAG: hypothetical protein IKN16_12340 [Selenomonadaceae bacterium]|nr:hypothetical protein [Selenomonadaceae bacterium]